MEFSISTIQVGSIFSPSSGRFWTSTAIAIMARTALARTAGSASCMANCRSLITCSFFGA